MPIMTLGTPPLPSRAVSRRAAFGHAMRGVARLLQTQANARIHAGAIVLVCALGVWLGLNPLEWAVLCLSMGLVLCTEALNTAIEFAVDLASPNWHALARDAKDIAAGAVLLASLAAVAVGLLVFVPKLMEKL